MKIQMLNATLALLLCSLLSSPALAKKKHYEEHTPVDIIDVEDGFPITKCYPPKQRRAVRDLRSMTKTALQLTKCGNYEESLSYLHESIYLVEYLAKTNKQPIQTKLGRCFSRRNCRSRISSQKVTKATCKSTLLGKSWQRVHPTVGACVNI